MSELLEWLFRDLHHHPELSMSEHPAAGVVDVWSLGAGYDVTTGIGGTGAVGA